MHNIKISVIMSFFNSENYLLDSINSILEQTHSNFELILLNDGSTDNSKNIVEKFNDTRIIRLENKKNLGVAKSFNKLIMKATGKYIAFMDSDDISEKNRIKEQLEFLENNKIDMCGTAAQQFGNFKNKKLEVFKNFKDLKTLMIIGNPIINSTVMIKTSVIKKLKCDENFISWDFELHSRLILNNYKIYNIDKILLYSRSHNNQDSIINYNIGIDDSLKISKKYFVYQDDIQIYKKYLDKINFGYCKSISYEDYKKSLAVFKRIIYLRKNNHNIIKLFNKNLILKIHPINYNNFIKILGINNRYNIELEFKHKILLFIRSIFNLSSNNFLILLLQKIFYFFKSISKKNA